jgi:hypothetical protein
VARAADQAGDGAARFRGRGVGGKKGPQWGGLGGGRRRLAGRPQAPSRAPQGRLVERLGEGAGLPRASGGTRGVKGANTYP